MKKILLIIFFIIISWPIESYANNEIIVSFYDYESLLIRKDKLEIPSNNQKKLPRECPIDIPIETLTISIEAGSYSKTFFVSEIEKQTLSIKSSIFFGTAYLKNPRTIIFSPWYNW